VHALINITGDGLLNLCRVAAPVGFKLDALIEPHLSPLNMSTMLLKIATTATASRAVAQHAPGQ
jgi:hypothetical protein